MSHPKLNTIASIGVIEGTVFEDFDKLTEILIDNYSNRLSDDPTSSRYEDSKCPSSPIIDNISVSYTHLTLPTILLV